MASASNRLVRGKSPSGASSRPSSGCRCSAACRRRVALAWIVWGQNYSFEVRWTLAAVVLVVWVGCAAAALPDGDARAYLAANLLGALHEGDYSIRGTGAKPGSAADLVMKEINSLGNTLQRQRSEAVESTALLTSVMGAIDVAVFAFDMDEKLVLANPAAERLFNKPAADDRASAIDRERRCGCERLPVRRHAAARRRGLRRRSTGSSCGARPFYRDGKPHQLLVFADLSRALREEAAARVAAHRPRPVARDQQLADADQVHRA